MIVLSTAAEPEPIVVTKVKALVVTADCVSLPAPPAPPAPLATLQTVESEVDVRISVPLEMVTSEVAVLIALLETPLPLPLPLPEPEPEPLPDPVCPIYQKN